MIDNTTEAVTLTESDTMPVLAVTEPKEAPSEPKPEVKSKPKFNRPKTATGPNAENCPACGFDVARGEAIKECCKCHTVFIPASEGKPLEHTTEDGVVTLRDQLGNAVSLEQKLTELYSTLKEGETVQIIDDLKGFRDLDTLIRNNSLAERRAIFTIGGIICAAKAAGFEIATESTLDFNDPSPAVIIRKPLVS